MKKILAIVVGIAFAFGTAGYVPAQTGTTAPALKAEDKKANEKKGEKVEKKGAAIGPAMTSSDHATTRGHREKKADGKKGGDDKKAAAPDNK